MAVYGLNKNQWIQVISSWGGWLMDGYVTIAYALVIGSIASLFFPAGSFFGTHPLVSAFMGLAVGAIARSVGSIFLGSVLGDRLGRKRMLTVTILLFSIFSALIGFLPTYNTLGIGSPLLLYALLFIVGLFAGAEYGGGAALSTESVPAEKRGFIGAFVQSGFGTGYFVASFAIAGLALAFPGSAFLNIGWRVLFFSTLIPGLLTLIIRAVTPESEVFTEVVKKGRVEKEPALSMVRKAPLQMFLAIMITSGLLYINTATFSFYPSIISLNIYIGKSDALMGTLVALINLISLFGVWTGGAISNYLGGRRTSMIIYTALFIILTYPLILIGYSQSVTRILVGFGIQAFVEALIFSTLPAFLSETFSKKFRTTAVGFTYNAGGITGGFALAIISIYATSANITSVWTINIIVAGAIMMIGILLSKETWSMRGNKYSVDKITE